MFHLDYQSYKTYRKPLANKHQKWTQIKRAKCIRPFFYIEISIVGKTLTVVSTVILAI